MTDADELRRRARGHESVAREATTATKKNRHEGIAEGYHRTANLLETARDDETASHQTRRADTLEIREHYPSRTVRRTYRPATDDADADAVLDIDEARGATDPSWRAKGSALIPALDVNGEARFDGATDEPDESDGGRR